MKTELRSPAKLTLSLRITGQREDGFHFIEAEMVSLDFSDRIVIADGDGLTIEGPEIGFSVVVDGNNLVTQALELLNRKALIHIEKKIPAGAGLGGGSTNAAAILRWAGFTDLVKASSIGADVSYCLAGGRVEPLPFVEKTFTLLTPPFGVSTPAVYKHWDEMGGPVGDNGNDLEPALLSYMPKVDEYKNRLAEISGKTPQLAGSGSTWFVEGSFPEEGCQVVKTVPSSLFEK